MRTGLLLASAAVLIGGVVYVATHLANAPSSAPPVLVRADAGAPRPDPLSTELTDPESRVAAEAGDPAAAPVADPAASAEMRPEDDLIPIERLVGTADASGVEAGRTAGSDFFEHKYAGRDAKVRRQAFDRLRSIVDAHAAGVQEKERELTADQLQSILGELDWLKSNPGS